MNSSKRWAIALIPFIAAAVTAACEDTIIKTLGPENDEVVTTTGGVFRYESYNLDNVHDRRVFTWTNPAGKALVKHNNFIHHGTVLITIRDATGALMDSVPAEWQLEHETSSGRPGLWTIKFEYFGARGRMDTSLEPAPDQ